MDVEHAQYALDMSKGHEGLKRDSGALDAKVILESTVDSSSFLVINCCALFL